MGEHSKTVPPSGSGRWLRCHASVWENKDLTDKGSEFAAEGTVAHAVGAHCYIQRIPVNAVPNVVDDMIEPVQCYIDLVRGLAHEADFVDIEARLDLSPWLGAGNGGTADALIVKGHTLYVIDLKYGRGVPVSAEGNEQLQLYALGGVELARLLGYEIHIITLVIHQPRIDRTPSMWSLTVESLQAFGAFVRRHVEAINAMLINGPDASEYNPGDKQCQWCGAKATCPALQAATAAAMREEFDTISVEPTAVATAVEAVASIGLTEVEKLARVLPRLDLVEDWCKALRKRAHELLLDGVEIPGYKLIAGRPGNRAWKDEREAEDILKSMRLLNEQMYKMKVISPTDAEKLLKDSPRRWNRLTPLIVRKPPEPTVVPSTDKRPSISAADIRSEFDVLEDKS